MRTENEIWSLLIETFRFEEVIRDSINAKEPAILAKYCFNLAKIFNLFYHNHRIISEENPVKRAVLIVTADIARRTMTKALDLMGIKIPEKM